MTAQTRINVRAVIEHKGRVLLCHFVDKGYYFFPGGGLEFTESAETALKRELREELEAGLISATFIGGTENLFDNNGQPYHELNLLFSTTIDNLQAQSQEAHIDFSWMPIGSLKNENVLPKSLVVAVVQWFKDKKTFWVGMGQ